MKVVAIGYNTAHYVYLFRSNLIRELIGRGYSVVVLTPVDPYIHKLKEIGATHVNLPMSMSTNPFKDLLLFLRFIRVLRKVRPDLYLGYTAKPNIYGSLACQALGIPVINNVAGLGATFIKNSFVTKVIKRLYSLALKRSNLVYFQNPDDKALFLSLGLVRDNQTGLLPGSGVDLYHFSYKAMNQEPHHLKFIFIGRVLKDKGILEFVEAARRVKRTDPTVRFQILGQVAANNPAAIRTSEMNTWISEGIVEYLGVVEDVRDYMEAADCVVLPSYREGTPRTLLEAAATGRPIITTDAVGCREVVDHGKNGLMCKVASADDLEWKIRDMISLTDEQRQSMGRAGRALVEARFCESIVINSYMRSIENILAQAE